MFGLIEGNLPGYTQFVYQQMCETTVILAAIPNSIINFQASLGIDYSSSHFLRSCPIPPAL